MKQAKLTLNITNDSDSVNFNIVTTGEYSIYVEILMLQALGKA